MAWWTRFLALASLVAAPSNAAEFTIDGVSFSDELGGFRLLSVSGQGTPDDPFVVVEEITTLDQAVLVIRGMPDPLVGVAMSNRALTAHPLGFAIRKVVYNATDRAWTGFDLELQVTLHKPSPYGDGLSFGQGADVTTRVHTDPFRKATVMAEPSDRIEFELGEVPPGGRLVMDFMVTDMVSRSEIFLVQRQPRLMSDIETGTELAHREP